MRVAVIGGAGFVGSAFTRHLSGRKGIDVAIVTRDSYRVHAGGRFDIVIDASCNSNKRLADQDPRQEFDLSVGQRLRTLTDFPAALQVHISSVDVYSDLASANSTGESGSIDIQQCSNYGFHKLIAEDLVRHYAPKWVILRLAGMVGQGLRKNPVFDILSGKPIYIHPDSQYQFMSTDVVARISMDLIERQLHGEVVNVCGDGLISPRQIAAMAGCDPLLSEEARSSAPRVVDIDIAKLKGMMAVPSTTAAIARFISEWNGGLVTSNVKA